MLMHELKKRVPELEEKSSFLFPWRIKINDVHQLPCLPKSTQSRRCRGLYQLNSFLKAAFPYVLTYDFCRLSVFFYNPDLGCTAARSLQAYLPATAKKIKKRGFSQLRLQNRKDGFLDSVSCGSCRLSSRGLKFQPLFFTGNNSWHRTCSPHPPQSCVSSPSGFLAESRQGICPGCRSYLAVD